MNQISLIPFYIQRKLELLFTGDNLRYLTELRGSPISRIFYNKPTILLNEIGRFLSFYSPIIYFGQSILIVLFPFWLIGVVDLIKRKRIKVFVLLLIVGIPVYLIDQREIIFVLPIALIYIYIIALGIKKVLKR